MRSTRIVVGKGFLQSLKKGKESFFTSLWNSPETRDNRVKQYVPEVLEESILEEKAVRLENRSRDCVVELGHKIIQEIEKKSPISRISPHLSKLMKEYGDGDIIRQRPLSYLVYPNSSVTSSNAEASHELVLSFADNFKEMIESVERDGWSVTTSSNSETPALSSNINDDNGLLENADGGETSENNSENLTEVINKNYEPTDVSLFVKVAAGMALANINCADLVNAHKCVDIALRHAKNPERIGGLYGMKAGIFIRQKKYDDAIAASSQSVQISNNLQGFLQGAYALRQLGQLEKEIQLLQLAKESHPMNQQIAAQYTEATQLLAQPTHSPEKTPALES